MNVSIKYCILFIALNLCTSLSAQITVEAGDGIAICYSGRVDLNNIGASISGEVSDGNWFTDGDGRFMPQNAARVLFSEAQYYQPGQNDRSKGNFTLTLVSDDPDGYGPKTEVSDAVTVKLMSSPILICNRDLTVSLPESCSQEIQPNQLLSNPVAPYEMYTLKLYQSNGAPIADNTITSKHINQTIRYVVGHSCSFNTCEGTFVVKDNVAPIFYCYDEEVICTENILPDSLGFPIPDFAIPTHRVNNLYSVTDWDGCGDVQLSYEDRVVHIDCQDGLERKIERTWRAVDVNGNVNYCTQTIAVKAIGLQDVLPPNNYDDDTIPALTCDGDWIKLANGYPSPETTGYPTAEGCTKIETKYTDTYHTICGAGFKILRNWLIVDWCTSANMTVLQVIAVKDTVAPKVTHQENITLGTARYSCVNEPFTLSVMDDDVVDCSSWTYRVKLFDIYQRDLTYDHIENNRLVNLPVGNYELHYIVQDDCGNTTKDTVLLNVIDDEQPNISCDEHTKVSVTTGGVATINAYSFDDYSTDNCGIVTMEVRKMTTKCGEDRVWSDVAIFCCEEIGEVVMVEFRVTDASGNSNRCMVEVKVEDKLRPVLYCPSDITISCNYDFDPSDLSVFGQVRDESYKVRDIYINDSYNNGRAGKDGYYADNCTATIEETSEINIDCGKGTITRTWVVTDKGGNTDECTQTITVIRDRPMTEDNIIWPEEYVVEGCDVLNAAVEITGKPTYQGLQCSRVESSHKDQPFSLTTDACIKILRHWTVIDWCQYDEATNEGIWERTQIIKIHNSEAPTLLNCEDRDVCDYDDCGTHSLNLLLAANDDCTDSTLLDFQWKVDLNEDGLIDISGTGNIIEKDVPYGTHRVYWSVEDKCGNISSCDYRINVKDCKLPTPYCITSISSAVMPSTGQLTIRAKKFDLAASDNCTTPENLRFSFTQNIADSLKILTCADITNGVVATIPLQIWVTDESGNQNYCSVSFLLQDNDDVCEDGEFVGYIAGRVQTSYGDDVPNVKINYNCEESTYSGETTTNGSGNFAANSLPKLLDYSISASYEGGEKDDVNSIDLLKIQRHVLELDTLSIYDMVAADVNGNKRVQASDLLVIRKYVLDIYKTFPRMPKWLFIDKNKTPIDALNPFDYTTSIDVMQLEDDVQNVDFLAIRMGNVDGEFTNITSTTTETRSNFAKEFIVKAEGDKYAFYVSEDMSYEAIELIIKGQVTHFESDIISDEEYVINDDNVKIAHIAIDGFIDADKPLFILTAPNRSRVKVSGKSFVYANEEVFNVRCIKENISLSDEVVIQDNPFANTLTFKIVSKRTEKATAQLFDLQGRRVLHSSVYTNDDEIINTEYLQSGVYILKITLNDGVHKVVKVVKQ